MTVSRSPSVRKTRPQSCDKFSQGGTLVSLWALADSLRRMQADALGRLGFAPAECRYSIVATGRDWRLRHYLGGGPGPLVVIVAAPIKRPYIWDLTPSTSAVGHCLREGFRVDLLEWLPPSAECGGGGLEDYAGTAIRDAVAAASEHAGGKRLFLAGHSLGGTLAAIFAAREPSRLLGLLLLAAPLCFAPGSSRIRDALASISPSLLASVPVVPGSLLSQLSAAADWETFVWRRALHSALGCADPKAFALNALVECWALDEVALPGRLVRDVLRQLYRENRFCTGSLSIGGNLVGPATLRVPTLAVVDVADLLVPPGSVLPFLAQMHTSDARLIEHHGGNGLALRHLAPLIEPRAHDVLWPRIFSWLRTKSASAEDCVRSTRSGR